MDPYSDDYYEGPLGLQNSNSARHTHAAYLLEMGSMPPIHPQDQAFAYLNTSLNSGAFAPAGNSVYDDSCELHQQKGQLLILPGSTIYGHICVQICCFGGIYSHLLTHTWQRSHKYLYK